MQLQETSSQSETETETEAITETETETEPVVFADAVRFSVPEGTSDELPPIETPLKEFAAPLSEESEEHAVMTIAAESAKIAQNRLTISKPQDFDIKPPRKDFYLYCSIQLNQNIEIA